MGTKPKRGQEYPATFADSDSSIKGKRQTSQTRSPEPSRLSAYTNDGGIPAQDMLHRPAAIPLTKLDQTEIQMQSWAQLPRVPTHPVSRKQKHTTRDQIKHLKDDIEEKMRQLIDLQIKQVEEEIEEKMRRLEYLRMSFKDSKATEINSDSDTSKASSAQHPPVQFRTNSGLKASKVRPSRGRDSDSSDSAEKSRSLVRHKRSTNISKSGIPALRNLPKTLVFNGKSNWLAFKLKFSRYAEVSHWTQDECSDCLLHCLTDQALTYGAMLLRRDSTLPYRKMMRKLEKRFGAEELPAAVQTQFYQATQKNGESSEEWADRVQTMATEAFRELPEKYSNEQVIARFCQGLQDIEAGHSVFMRNFSTIEDAMNEVRLYQHAKQAMGNRLKHTGQSVTATDHEYPTVQVRAVQLRDKLAPSNIESILEKMQLELTEVKEQLYNRDSFSGSESSGSYGQGRGYGRGGGGRSKACYGCQEEGHFVRSCPKLQALNKNGSEARA